MQNNFDLTLFFQKFPTEESCRTYLENRLWKDGCKCPHCGGQHIYRYKNKRLFKCGTCTKQFQVTTNTIYQNSNLPLQKWFLAYYLIATNKKGISSIQLSKALGITQKSAWYLAHKIRFVLQHDTIDKPLNRTIEVDETYIGGRKKGKRGRGSENKTPVFGMLQRGGKLIIMPVENTKRKTLEPLILKHVQKGAQIMSDEWWAYRQLHKHFRHETVNHGAKEYVRGRVHVNSLEGAWSLLKRSIRGVYHRPSKEHLEKYCAEFQFKYNTRKLDEDERFSNVVAKSNKRVRHRDIT